MSSNNRHPFLFRIARGHLAFWTDRIYYRKVHVHGRGNVPPPGTPVLLASNHQQALNDALCVVTSLRDRKPTFLARGDVFSLNPLLGRFLRWIGILPAFRLKMDGAAAMQGNYASFGEAAERLLEGGTVAIFPEGKHQEGHWLGPFSPGYLRIVFGAAEASGFEKEIFIVPMCNHYSEFRGLRHQEIPLGIDDVVSPRAKDHQGRRRTDQQGIDID